MYLRHKFADHSLKKTNLKKEEHQGHKILNDKSINMENLLSLISLFSYSSLFKWPELLWINLVIHVYVCFNWFV